LFFATWDCAAAQVILMPPGAVRVPEREVPVRREAQVFPEVPLAAETVASWPTRGHDDLVKLGDEFWDRVVGEVNGMKIVRGRISSPAWSGLAPPGRGDDGTSWTREKISVAHNGYAAIAPTPAPPACGPWAPSARATMSRLSS
jgi:hypothetical protein